MEENLVEEPVEKEEINTNLQDELKVENEEVKDTINANKEQIKLKK